MEWKIYEQALCGILIQSKGAALGFYCCNDLWLCIRTTTTCITRKRFYLLPYSVPTEPINTKSNVLTLGCKHLG